MNDRRHISVFIASPGDLAPERKVFKDTIDALNVGFADGAGVTFVPVGWEELKAQTGRRTQSVINLEIQKSDIFILALSSWRCNIVGVRRRPILNSPRTPRKSST